MNIFLTILIILLAIVAMIGLWFYGVYTGAKLTTHRMSFILYQQGRMSFDELNKYSDYFEILNILKMEYYEKRNEESKQEDCPDYWKVDTKKNMHS